MPMRRPLIPRAGRAWCCPECGFVYLTRADYRDHYRRDHLPPARATSSSSADWHTERVVDPCPECGSRGPHGYPYPWSGPATCPRFELELGGTGWAG